MPTTYVVRQGDCWARIAKQFGFPDYKLLYDDPANAELKAKRPNPNVLRPGDKIEIPDITTKTIDIGSGQKHKLQVKSVRKALRIKLVAHDGQPLAGEDYELDIGDGEPRTGSTDGDGKLEELVPSHLPSATLTVTDRVLVLRLGHLNPVAEAKQGDLSGAQGRLKNLGYDPGPADGKYGPRTRAALAIFQSDEGLEVTGEIDDPTLDKLEEAHGC
jgi:N-acetylmuramoyl-L-alanine amidase